MRSMELTLSPLDSTNFAPFGAVITPAAATRNLPVNDGMAVRYDRIADITIGDAAGTAAISIFRTRFVTLPLRLTMLERHPLGAQAFLAQSLPFIAVVHAPAPQPQPEGLHAFWVPAGCGICYGAGVWHHPLLAPDMHAGCRDAAGGYGDFVAVDRVGPGKNCDTVRISAWDVVLPENIIPTEEEKR